MMYCTTETELHHDVPQYQRYEVEYDINSITEMNQPHYHMQNSSTVAIFHVSPLTLRPTG